MTFSVPDNNFGGKLRRLRQQKGIQAADLAEKLRMTEGELVDIEEGRIRELESEEIITLCRELDIPGEILFA